MRHRRPRDNRRRLRAERLVDLGWRQKISNPSKQSRLSPLLAKKAARSFLAVVETGKAWTVSDAQRCLPLGWRLNESFAANREQLTTIDALTNAYRQFASKI